mmetsp:Transcript_19847/g.55334  ORF Transcript_19847/g.55334 Transcript_19847/m.55334 type:complete len:106 (+) Transcript_19847:652-969(+)
MFFGFTSSSTSGGYSNKPNHYLKMRTLMKCFTSSISTCAVQCRVAMTRGKGRKKPKSYSYYNKQKERLSRKMQHEKAGSSGEAEFELVCRPAGTISPSASRTELE